MAPEGKPGAVAESRTLHFFPGPKRLISVVNGKKTLEAEAWGGVAADPGVSYDIMKPQPTTPGTYIIASYGPYRTPTWPMSRIAWGTKLTVVGARVMYETGLKKRPWRYVDERIPGMDMAEIKRLYWALYERSELFDSNRDLVPDVWVFNDFGAMAVRYFRDRNKNRRLDQDKGEGLSGEMIHTTPQYEAQHARGQPVTLDPSHGCIHVTPSARASFLGAGAFASGVTFIIHKYQEGVPAQWQ
jgi:hypothetical protein